MSKRLSEQQVNTVAGSVFLIGLGVLFLMKSIFPGILIVSGLTVLVRELLLGRSWWASQGAIWLIGLGLIFQLGADGGRFVGLILVLCGLAALVTIFSPPPFLRKPEPFVDSRME